MGKNKSLLNIFSLILVVYPFFYPLKDLMGHFGQYLFFALWLFWALVDNYKLIVTIYLKMFPYLLFIVGIAIRVILSSKHLNFSFFSPVRIVNQHLIFYIYITYSFWSYHQSKRHKKNIVISVIIASTISVLINLLYLSKNPFAIRASYREPLFAIGDFNLVYSSVLLVLFYLNGFIKNKQGEKNTMLILFLLNAYFVVKSNYATALFLMIFNIFIYIYISIYRRSKRLFIYCILLLPGVYVLLPRIIMFVLENYTLNFVLQQRLLDVLLLLKGDGLLQIETLGSRYALVLKSLNSFYEYPFFGINYSLYDSTTIGGHSQYFDNLARFGFLGNAYLIILMTCYYLKVKKFSGPNNDIFTVSIIYFIFLGMLNNNMLPSLLIIVFIVIPSTSKNN